MSNTAYLTKSNPFPQSTSLEKKGGTYKTNLSPRLRSRQYFSPLINKLQSFSGVFLWWRWFQESSWISSLALCALCWTVSSSGACPDSSTRARAFCTVVSLAPPRSPSRYCSSTENFSSGIWQRVFNLPHCTNHVVCPLITSKYK